VHVRQSLLLRTTAGPHAEPARSVAVRELHQRIDARIVAEEVERETAVPRGAGRYAYELVLRALARSAPSAAACGLSLTLSRQRLVDGEEVVVQLSTTRPAHALLFSIDARDRITPLSRIPLLLAAGTTLSAPRRT